MKLKQDLIVRSNDLWKRKIRAFLYRPPHGALAAESPTVKRWPAEVIQAALDCDCLDDVEEADRIAQGLDIPPFVEQVPADVFRQDPCLTHPLSGELYRLQDLQERLPSLDPAKLQGSVVEAVKAIREEIETSQSGQSDSLYKRLFLDLWRRLPEAIQHVEQVEQGVSGPQLGALWDLLPADPRIPSHSVWDHAAIASAVASALPCPALLLFDLASIQDFVASARRTQDAWMGSFLPSYLIWEAIKVIADEFGPDCLVYPSLREQPLVDLWLFDKNIRPRGDVTDRDQFLKQYRTALQIASFPERFTAIVPADRAQALAEKAHGALQERWKAIAWAVRCEVEAAVASEMYLSLACDSDWKDAWERQIDDGFKRLGIFWVVCPWGSDPQHVIHAYEQLLPSTAGHPARKQYDAFCAIMSAVTKKSSPQNLGMVYSLLSRMAAQALTARKTLRDFQQLEEPDWKCSLCGLRQALRPEYPKLRETFKTESDETLLRLFWERLAAASRRGTGLKLQGRIRRGDRLCAVCLTKRLALEGYFEADLGFDRHLFPSTATIATVPFKIEVIERYKTGSFDSLRNYVTQVKAFLETHGIFYESSAVPRLETMCESLEGPSRSVVEGFLRIDGEWLFEESFDPEKIRREYPQVKECDFREELRSKAVQALRALLEAVRKRPPRYYAILAMDGDKMSAWVAGHMAPLLEGLLHPRARSLCATWSLENVHRPLGPTLHLALSTALKNFALEIVRTVVEEEYLGKLIYAGGDDVLAFLPVNDLLPVMRKLRRLFQGENCTVRVGNKIIQTENGFAKITVGNKEQRRLLAGAFHAQDCFGKPWQGPTASVGAVIVHESHPLTPAIERARDALKKHAKEKMGRDAFAIHLIRRAGEPLEMGMKWYVREVNRPGQLVDILEYIEGAVGFMREGTLSSQLAYDMKDRQAGLAGALEDFRGGRVPWWLEAQAKELERLIDRHLKRGIPRDKKQEIKGKILQVFQAVQNGLKAYIAEWPEDVPIPEGLDDPWQLLTKLLLLARFIAVEG